MKKLILAAAFAATFSLSAVAANGGKKYDDDSKNISYYVLNQFNTDFRDAENVTWTITPTSQKADFTIEGVKKTAFYNLNGAYLGVTEDIAFTAIPKSAQKEIGETYKGYTPGQVIKFLSSDPEPAFYVNLAIQAPESIDYFIDLKKADSEVIVRVNTQGSVFTFKTVK